MGAREEVEPVDAAYEKEVGARLRALREERGLTQEQLSAKLQLRGCDITRSALAKMEVGQRHIYLDELNLFREILGVSFETLMLGEEKPEQRLHSLRFDGEAGVK